MPSEDPLSKGHVKERTVGIFKVQLIILGIGQLENILLAKDKGDFSIQHPTRKDVAKVFSSFGCKFQGVFEEVIGTQDGPTLIEGWLGFAVTEVDTDEFEGRESTGDSG